MTFTKIVKDIFTKTPKAAKDNSANGGVKAFMSKLSGAFMLPISVMAIAGLFLGVGAAFESHTSAVIFGKFIKALGDPVFGAMPALFMVAVVIAFTEEAGVAVFAGLVSFLVFNAIQSPFIQTTKLGPQTGTVEILGIQLSNNVSEKMYKIVGSFWGMKSLNTSIFGGIIVGFIMAWAYNRFHQIQLPAAIAFFGGKRFVALVGIILMIPLAFAFLLIWPWIGLGLGYFGEYSGKVAGLDSFIFGYVERSLIPFGLHHVFYAPLWWTHAGGDVVDSLNNWDGTIQLIDGVAANKADLLARILDSNQGNNAGDSFGWLAVNGTGIDTITFTPKGGSQQTLKIFDFISKQLDLRLGRFMQGKFSFMQLGLPAAGAAMVVAAPKVNRKNALAIVFPASLTSFITGVTEPIEFTFLFLAPLLFWGFHALMAAFSFLLMNLFGAHVGMTFSGGFIDTIIYGALPISQGTHFYWMYVIGVVYAPIYFFVFLWWIKKFDLATPGRGGNAKLFTKADYRNRQSGAGGSFNPQAQAIVAALGGWNNITKFANCATRLRYDVKDQSQVDKASLKAAGAAGVVLVGKNHVQTIIGPKAEQLNSNIKANIGAELNASAKTAKKKVVNKATTKNVVVKSVASGTAASLASLKDGVFSKKMMGDGLVVKFPASTKKGSVYAPVSGKLVTAFPTGHAYGIKTKEGVEVLVHIGIDTVNLNGKGFKSLVKQGATVTAGDKLADVDVATVKKSAPSADPIVIVTSGQKVLSKATGKVTKNSKLFTVS